MISVISAILIALGCFFFVAGTVGLMRFPDVFCRLHALSKCDNLGLGFVIFGVGLQFGQLDVALKLLLIWFLVLLTSAISSHLIARQQYRSHGDKHPLRLEDKNVSPD